MINMMSGVFLFSCNCRLETLGNKKKGVIWKRRKCGVLMGARARKGLKAVSVAFSGMCPESGTGVLRKSNKWCLINREKCEYSYKCVLLVIIFL